MKRFIILIPVMLLLSVSLWAGNIPATFYVDTAGSDSNTGLATDNAWATVAKVNAYSRTNLAIYSEQFGNTGVYVISNSAVDNNVTLSPDGTTNADNVTADGIGSANVMQVVGKDASAAVTYSYYVKPDNNVTWIALSFYEAGSGVGHRAWFNVATGAVGTTTAINAGYTNLLITIEPSINGFYRCRFSGTSGAGTDVNLYMNITDGDGTLGTITSGWKVSLFGIQLETGLILSPYIPVLNIAVTASFQPGDSVLFKRGQTWAEHVVVPSSGTSGAKITFGTYGSGAYPVFYDINGKTNVTNNLFNTFVPPFPSFPTMR